MPKTYTILDHFEWTTDDMSEVILMNETLNSDPYENAKKWVVDSAELVKKRTIAN